MTIYNKKDDTNITDVHQVFTFDEAIEFIKNLDRLPTTHIVNWINIKTRKPVTIGYNNNFTDL